MKIGKLIMPFYENKKDKYVEKIYSFESIKTHHCYGCKHPVSYHRCGCEGMNFVPRFKVRKVFLRRWKK